jgi:hypothetical protein
MFNTSQTRSSRQSHFSHSNRGTMKHVFKAALVGALILAVTSQVWASTDITITSSTILHTSFGAATEAVAGPPVNGLAVALNSQSSVVGAGQPITLAIEVRNTGTSDRSLYLADSPCAYRFVVTDNSTRRSRAFHVENCEVRSGHPENLSPGQAVFVRFELPTNALFSATSAYSLAIKGLSWYPNPTSAPTMLSVTSNTVSIQRR